MPASRPSDLCHAPWDANALRVGAKCWALTSGLVFAAVFVAVTWFPAGGVWRGYIGSLAYADGQAYAELAVRGYTDEKCVAWFPAFPLLGRLVKSVTGLRADASLALVANVCLLLAFLLLAFRVATRTSDKQPTTLWYTLLAAGLWPSTFYFRMAYSESLFVLCALASLYAMERRWPLWRIALIVGLTTATRPVGVAVVVVFGWHLWRQSAGAPTASNDLKQAWFSRAAGFTQTALLYLPLACWGLIAYMTFLHVQFGDALAFANAQDFFRQRPTAWQEKWLPLLTGEPIWSPYFPESATYWRRYASAENPLLSFGFMNPLFFVATAALIAVGSAKKWLDPRELLLSAALLAIPYVTMAYDNVMVSQPRFTAVVFPMYMVLGRVLAACPKWVAAVFFVASGALLAYYAAGFAAGYGSTYRFGGVYRIFY
jgi:hypothetical protein